MSKLIFINPSPYPSSSGGIDNWLYNITRVIEDDLDIESIVICADSDDRAFYEVTNFKKTKVIRVGALGRKILHKYMIKYGKIISFLSLMKWSIYATYSLLKEYKSGDVVISLHTFPAMLPCILVKLFKRNANIVCYLRGRTGVDLQELGYKRLSKLYLVYEKFTLKFSSKIITNGWDTDKYVKSFHNLNSIVLNNGVDTKRFDVEDSLKFKIRYEIMLNEKLNQNDFIIVSVATLRDIKGIKYLIDAVSIIKSNGYYNITVLFIGKGDPARYIEMSKILNVNDNIRFIGEKKNINEYLQCADIGCAISGGGGISNAALEMMAAGVPIVAWNNLTYSQILEHNKDAHLVNENDSFALAQGIIKLINDHSYRNRIGLESKKESKFYDWSKVTDAFVSEIFMSNNDMSSGM